MIPPKFQIHGWKRLALVVLLIIGVTWSGLKWAEKQFADLYYKKNDECVGYDSQIYHAFSLLRIIRFEDYPTFIRVIDKKTGRVIGETGVYWIRTGASVLCPNFSTPNEISVIFAGNIGVTETFRISP